MSVLEPTQLAPNPELPPSGLTRLLRQHLIPHPRIGRQLAAVSLLDALGSGMFYTGSALYFTGIVGLSAGQVGLGLSLGGFAGLAGAVPIGMLADRFKAGQVYIGLQVLRALCYTAYCFVTNFAGFAVVAGLIGITDAAIPPVHQAVVGATVAGEDRVDTLAKIRAVRNLGFGLGALIAMLSIGQGSRLAFVILIGGNALSYFLVAYLLRRIGIGAVATRADGAKRPPLTIVPEPRYLSAAVLCGVLAVHSTLLAVAVPLWFAGHTKVPAVLIGLLIAGNTVLAVLFQARLARPCGTVPGAVKGAIWAGFALAGFAVASQLAQMATAVWIAIGLAVVAVVMLTLGELWHSAASWTISYELADPHRRTAYLSTFQLGVSLQAIVAPWLITNLLFPTAGGWLAFGGVTIAAGLLIWLVLARYRSRPDGDTEPEAAPEAIFILRDGWIAYYKSGFSNSV